MLVVVATSSACGTAGARDGAEDRRAADRNGPLQPGPVDRLIGTAHPILVDDIAPNGDWMVICQDRTPNAGMLPIFGAHGVLDPGFRPYLVIGTGEGIPIESFVAADPTGRFVAVVRNGHLSLIDVQSKEVTDLRNADLSDDKDPFRRYHAATFDGHGSLMLYLRKAGRSSRLVLRSLPSGKEREVNPGPGAVWRTYLDPDGHWVMADVSLTPDDWPALKTDLSPRGCGGAASAFFVAGRNKPARLARRWAPVGASRMNEVDGLIRPVQGGVLIRDKDDAIVRVGTSGDREESVPSSCHGKVLYADWTRGRVAAVCAGPKARTGIFTLFDQRKALFEVPSMRAPMSDQFIVPVDGIMQWDGQDIDLNGTGRLDRATAAKRRARLVAPYSVQRNAVLAARGDGATLRAVGSQAEDRELPMGPVRWFPSP
jgi:hypothetical protein